MGSSLPRYECKRCGHVWIPRRDAIPRICPACKSKLWAQEKGARKA